MPEPTCGIEFPLNRDITCDDRPHGMDKPHSNQDAQIAWQIDGSLTVLVPDWPDRGAAENAL